MQNFQPANRIKKFAAPTVWHVFSPMAVQYNAINLGQGFPGWPTPNFAKNALADATKELLEPSAGILINQYARSAGHPSLVSEIAKEYSAIFETKVDPNTEVVVCNGATETLYCAINGILNPGDEMVTFEPAFDIYHACADMAGAVVKTVPLRVQKNSTNKKEWYFDKEELRKAFTPRTKMFLLNTPQNPTGKVMNIEELSFIATLLHENPNVVCVSDEVYSHLTYDDNKHISIASLPGMQDRTLTVSSAGKTFSCTGWKVGWAVGPAELIRAVAIVHQWTCFSVHTPSQAAVALMLRQAREPYEGYASYYQWLRAFYTRKRDILSKCLSQSNIDVIMPEGAFFIIGLTERLNIPADNEFNDEDIPYDWKLCKWLTKDIGVASIPPSSFYCKENAHLAKYFARFAFCKPDEMLEEAGKRLLKLKDFSLPPSKM